MDSNGTSGFDDSPKRRVLVIGRERAAAEATERYLAYCGHEVAVARDPERAWSKAEELKPQVLVCDLNPASRESRVRAARRIQQHHRTALVIISNHRCAEVRDRFTGLKVSRCLRKPVRLSHLAAAVSRARVV